MSVDGQGDGAHREAAVWPDNASCRYISVGISCGCTLRDVHVSSLFKLPVRAIAAGLALV